MYLLSIVLMMFGLMQTSISSDQATINAVKELEQRYTAALLKRDAATFKELLADDMVHISFEGQIVRKDSYMDFFTRGSWQYKKYESSDVLVKSLGNGAVVTGRVDRIITISDKDISGAFSFTHVWTKTGDRWRLTSSHVTTLQNN
jgi:ketosteroid isomerase-like protein